MGESGILAVEILIGRDADMDVDKGSLTGQETLVLYGVPQDSEAGKMFRSLGIDFGAEIIELETWELERTLRSVFAREMYQKSTVDAGGTVELEAARGFCVFCGFTKSGFEQLLKRWHEAKVSHVAQKAVATTHNLDWPLHALFNELEREHAVTTAFVALRKDVHRLEQGLRQRGIDPEQLPDTEEMTERRNSLDAAKQMLSDIRRIETAEQVVSVHQRLSAAWKI